MDCIFHGSCEENGMEENPELIKSDSNKTSRDDEKVDPGFNKIGIL